MNAISTKINKMWPEQIETKQLIAQAKGGDESAVNQLMDRHRNSLRQLVRMRLDKKIQKRVDVSDVVQDVLVEANRRLPTVLGRSSHAVPLVASTNRERPNH